MHAQIILMSSITGVLADLTILTHSKSCLYVLICRLYTQTYKKAI